MIVCEDVRQEARNQQSLIGVIGGEIQTESAPLQFPRLCFRFELLKGGEGKRKIHFGLTTPSGITMFPTDGEIEVNPSQRTVIVLQFIPVSLSEEGTYTVRFGTPGQEREIEAFTVDFSRKAKTT